MGLGDRIQKGCAMSKNAKKRDRKPALKFCPFCGSENYAAYQMTAELANGEYYAGEWLECEGCGMQGPIAVWNRRTYRK